MRIALYARYSSDNQRDASIADQFRVTRDHADKQGEKVVEEYSDHAISGASLLRPGIQALIMDAQKGRFDLVLAEALDRLSRDQEDIAGFYKRMSFCGVKLVTLSEGSISELHIGLKGTMNALFLKDLAEKTRRGQKPARSPAAIPMAMIIVKSFDGNGEPVRGERSVNPREAEVIWRIFREYAAGKSPKKIATDLNRKGIRAPSGGDWSFSTILGNPKRGTGILNNELYIGRLVWNRQSFVKDPDTGKRQARLNPRSEWIVQEVPKLRIVDDALWQAVHNKKQTIKRNPANSHEDNRLQERKRPRYLPIRPCQMRLLR
jgi:DNA invertase Pin-like site-specific DNA recombinase